MFAATSKAVVKALGAQGDLVSNENMNERIKPLTLVKVSKRNFWPVITYTIIDQSLLDLLEEADVSPEYTEDIVMENFQTLSSSERGICGTAEVNAPEFGLGLSKFKVSVDNVDAASSFTLKKKMVDIVKLRKDCTNKRINEKNLDMLQVKETEKLTFVEQTIYNTTAVTFVGLNHKAGSISAAFKSFFKLFASSSNKETTTFTIPGIPPRTRKVRHHILGWWNIFSDAEEHDFCRTLQQVVAEMNMKEHLMQPLADFPESTRRDLLKHLSELLKDRRALTLLEETWDQDSTGESDCPQPVSSFMELLKTSNTSTSQKDAVHLLISAMDTLPDDLPALLISCSHDTLRVLNQLVDRLKEDTQAKLPESLPPPLQEEGELRWVVELFCSTNQTLEQLSDQWDRPEFPPGVMLEVLSLVVRGLSLMQPRTD
ncbi:gasdermin-E-like isoform X2 [Channa argus]|uniref:gasdermin-E-like isoform X2 n=1 Tax=Channa argus TaxID=215402 RepID=UPI0035229F6F